MAANAVIVWLFETDLQGLFSPYEVNISNGIEDAFSKSPSESAFKLATIDHLSSNYEVDFTGMMQTNIQSWLPFPYLVFV